MFSRFSKRSGHCWVHCRCTSLLILYWVHCKCVPLILHWFLMFVLRWPLAVHRTFKSNYKSTFIIFRMSKKVSPATSPQESESRMMWSFIYVQSHTQYTFRTCKLLQDSGSFAVLIYFPPALVQYIKIFTQNTWHCQGKWYQNKLAQIQITLSTRCENEFLSLHNKLNLTICSSKGGLVCIQQLLTNKLKF